MRKPLDPTVRATRWVAITRNGEAVEVAITTPNGKRLLPATGAEVRAYLTPSQRYTLVPITAQLRVTPAAPDGAKVVDA